MADGGWQEREITTSKSRLRVPKMETALAPGLEVR